MIKGIIFDLDHTLFDRYKTLTAVSPVICSELKEYIREDVSVSEFARALCDSDKKYVIYGWEKILEDLSRKNIFAKVPDFNVYSEAVKKSYLTKAVEYPFTKPMLKKLKEKGYALGIITNGSSLIQRRKIELLGLDDYFDYIIVGGEVGAQKPDRKPFDIMSQKLGIPSHELIYAGDNPINDIQGARNAGYIPVWVKTCGVWCSNIEKCQFSVDSVEEIPHMVSLMK